MSRLLCLLAALVTSNALAGEAEPVLVDRLAIDTALVRQNIEPSRTDVVLASQTNDVSLKYDPVAGYTRLAVNPRLDASWLEVQGSHTRAKKFNKKAHGTCTRLDTAIAPLKGATDLDVYRRSASPQPEETDADLLVAKSRFGDTVMTWLNPGEQVLMIEVTRETGEKNRRIELVRQERDLIVSQDFSGTEACLSDL